MVSRSNKEAREHQSVDGGGKVKAPEVGMGVAWAQGRKGGGGGGNPTMEHDTSIGDDGSGSEALSKGAEAAGGAIAESRRRRRADIGKDKGTSTRSRRSRSY